MEEHKEIVNRWISKRMKAGKAAQVAGFSRSDYYYKSNGRIPGKKPTQASFKEDGTIIKNTVVVQV